MYKDKDRQRESGKERTRRYRENRKALLSEGVTGKASHVIPKHSGVTPDGSTTMDIVSVLHKRILANSKVKLQSHSPMMAGYVPPKEHP